MNYSSKVQPKIELSTRQIIFKPGDQQDFAREDAADSSDRTSASANPDLTVTVTNTTENFVSFQLELDVEGQNRHSQANWYVVEPNVCAKKPPGDRTQFHVHLLRAPIPAYDTTVPLRVKIFSAELASLSAIETVYLKVLRPTKTLRVFFPFQDLSVYPGARLKIPVLVYNLNPQLREITLRLEGINPEWFPDGIEQTTWVDVGSSSEVEFWCAPPAVSSTEHRLYQLSVQAIDADGNSASTGGYFQILPFGQLRHAVEDAEKVIPDQSTVLSAVKGRGVAYDWLLENASNVPQTIYLQANEASLPSGIQTFAAPLTLLPDATSHIAFQMQVHRPWLGWTRTHFVEVWPTLEHPDSEEPIPEITVNPASQLLTLKVRPRIPLIVQFLIAAISGLTLWTLWFLSPKPLHSAPVNVVRLLGNANLVISGSSDQTLRQWQVNRAPWQPDVRRLTAQGLIEEPAHTFGKAIRVAELMPADLKQVAVGLENGEIQLWDVDPPRYLETLLDGGQYDRVFDLAFTNDSRYLFSGHGSGTVRGWTQRQGQWHPDTKLYWGLPTDLSFAIASIAVSPDDELVAIAGQFNRLTLWDWQVTRRTQQAIAYDIPYDYLPSQADTDNTVEEASIPPVTSHNSYLTNIDFASQNPRLMATADSLGIITVWDLQQLRRCMPTAKANPRATQDQHRNQLKVLRTVDCPTSETILAQWQAGRQGSVIREIAFDKTGCYLASTGDDGRISVWPLTSEGALTESPRRARIDIATFPNQPLNSVDIHRTQANVLLVAADTPGHRVQLYRKQVLDHGCQ
ncbi:hypothetical protein PN498_10950 [Oscillatoria sp. CS-180]|uniref:WD40 repeat domain-containing protein n=1 Tax=Oscillatoria sp. CS-180 TaxID=3021720 RepID=UPI00232D34DE|nr:hypothetical protein [Oscillatoria sp. CS-180]MDB9526508.1 hypothetical protein [Oscillatoria sp. CS-180]